MRERDFLARITWREQMHPLDPTVDRSREERVIAVDYWRVYRELLDRGAFPECRHQVEVWEVGNVG